MKPIPPTVRALDADGSEFFLDSTGRAFRADSSRVPDLDGPAAVDAASVADTARALAEKWAVAKRVRDCFLENDHGYARGVGRMQGIESAARACGPQVEAAFRALVTGDASRAPEVERG